MKRGKQNPESLNLLMYHLFSYLALFFVFGFYANCAVTLNNRSKKFLGGIDFRL